MTTCYNTTKIITGKKLESISTDDGMTIDFIYESTQRPDLPLANGLVSGKINEIRVSHNSEIISTHLFEHESQFSASNPHIYTYLNNDDVDANNNVRLILRSIRKGTDNPYVFQYYGDDDPSMRVPSRFSFARDAWGYFNGVSDNQSLVPAYSIRDISGLISLGNANREPDPEKMMAGVLKKIIYPLGGETSFSYEAHNKEIDLVDKGGCTETIRTSSVELSSMGDEGPKSVEFTITDNTFDIWVDYQTNVPEQYTIGHDPVFGEPFSLCNIEEHDTPVPDGFENFHISVIKPLSIPNGTYRINLRTSGFIDELDENMNPIPSQTQIRISWKERELFCAEDRPRTEKIYYGGLRVKGIYSQPNDPTTPARYYTIEKEYEYHDLNLVTDFYSGQQLSYDSFYSMAYQVDGPGCETDPYFTSTGDEYEFVHTLSSESIRPGYQSITYGQIDEIRFDLDISELVLSENTRYRFGKTSYFYDYQPDVIVPSSLGPQIYAVNDFSFVSGDLVRVDDFVYDSIENIHILKKRTVYDYTTYNNAGDPHYREIWGLKVSRTHAPANFWTSTNCFSVVPRYSSIFYRSMSIWKELNSKTEYYYDGRIVEKSETYSYNDSKQLIRKNTDIDAQTTLSQSFFYPSDFVNEIPIYSGMVASNLMEAPIFTLTSYVDQGSLQGAMVDLVYYEYSNPEFGKYRISQISENSITDQDTPLTTYSELYLAVIGSNSKTTSITYDSNDRVIQIEKNGFFTSYVNSQDGRNTLAVISNSEEENIFYDGFEYSSDNTPSRIGDKALTASGSFVIPKSFTNTANLVMSYWGFDGTEWHFSGELPFSQEITGSFSIIDEVRVYPIGAQMITYSYKAGTVVSSITDPNNITTSYKYDDNMRLTSVYDEYDNLLKFIEYNQRPQN